MVDGEEVLGADVLTSPEMVGDGHVVVVKGGVEQATAAADVEHEGHVRFVEHIPEGVEVGMRGRPIPRRRRRDHHRRASDLDRFADERRGATRVDQGNEGHGKESSVVRAEVGHGAVLGRRAGVEPVGVAAGEHRGGERGEHQLPVESEEVEHVAAFDGIEGAHRHPSLVLEQALLRSRRLRRIRPTCLGSLDGLLEHGLEPVHPPPAQAVTLVGRDVLVEEVGQFHHMAVGVEDRALSGVAHATPQETKRISDLAW